MPRIETIRVFRWLWVAWEEDDYRRRSYKRVGLTHSQAWDRCVSAGRAAYKQEEAK